LQRNLSGEDYNFLLHTYVQPGLRPLKDPDLCPLAGISNYKLNADSPLWSGGVSAASSVRGGYFPYRDPHILPTIPSTTSRSRTSASFNGLGGGGGGGEEEDDDDDDDARQQLQEPLLPNGSQSGWSP